MIESLGHLAGAVSHADDELHPARHVEVTPAAS
jgi:hypothetical protein